MDHCIWDGLLQWGPQLKKNWRPLEVPTSLNRPGKFDLTVFTKMLLLILNGCKWCVYLLPFDRSLNSAPLCCIINTRIKLFKTTIYFSFICRIVSSIFSALMHLSVDFSNSNFLSHVTMKVEISIYMLLTAETIMSSRPHCNCSCSFSTPNDVLINNVDLQPSVSQRLT